MSKKYLSSEDRGVVDPENRFQFSAKLYRAGMWMIEVQSSGDDDWAAWTLLTMLALDNDVPEPDTIPSGQCAWRVGWV